MNQAFKFPLICTKYNNVNDSKGTLVFQFLLNIADSSLKKTMDKINEIDNTAFERKPIFKVSKTNQGMIVLHKNEEDSQGVPFILIRGWGYLTGFGSLNLNEKIAAKIQDELRDFIIEKLNK